MTKLSEVEKRTYLDVLNRARQELIAAEARYAEIIAQIDATELQCRRLARIVVTLSDLIGEEPPQDVVLFLKTPRQKFRKPRTLPPVEPAQVGP